MKKNYLVALFLMIVIGLVKPAWSQNGKDVTTPVTGFGAINFKALADKELLKAPVPQKQRDNEEKENKQKGIPYNLPVPNDAKVFNVTGNFVTTFTEGVQLSPSPTPNIKFDGISDNGAIIPPDVNGAVGPTHIFETLNSEYKIFNKTGGLVSSLSLATFWSALNASGTPYSDPHIVYDANVGKWFSCIIANLSNGHYGIFVAASFTNDPTGSWYEYSFDAGPSNILPDYPLLGYSKRWVVITTNDFNNFVFSQSRITVLNKAKLSDGTLTSASTFYDPGLFTISPAETMDAGENTEYMLSNYNGNSGGSGYVKVCTITGSAAAPVYTAGAVIGVNQPWSDVSTDGPQKNIANKINTGGTKMRAIILRNGYIWATHTVYLPAAAPTRSASDFWQIDAATNAVIQYGRIDDPTAAFWYSYPSLAVTSTNDVLIGSTMLGSTIFASAVYAYRNSADAANTFRSVYKYQAGKATYYKTFGGSRNRWGDFSATCIDPADGTFWTLQEYAKKPKNTWGTSWANVTATAFSAKPINASAISSIADRSFTISPNPAKGDFFVNYQSAKAGNALLNIYDMNGLVVYSKKVAVASGLNRINVNLPTAFNGNYKVTLQNDTELKQTQLIINK